MPDRHTGFMVGSLDKIVEIRDFSKNSPVQATVVVVTYKRNQQLIECLDSLTRQSYKDFETIVIDNGKNEAVHASLSRYKVRHILLKKNYGLSMGRNIGIEYARGDIIIFLDDDAIASPDLVQSHVEAHQELNIVGLRGKAIGKTQTIYNDLQQHYDIGEKIKPAVVNLGGNASFKRDMLIEVGGFDPDFFGHEDLELTYRIVKKYGKNKVIYYPKAVIYHDFANSLKKHLKKHVRHSLMWDMLEETHPHILEFQRSYTSKGQKKNQKLGLFRKMKLRTIKGLEWRLVRISRMLRGFRKQMTVRKRI